jgi:hypothetical protein
VNTYGTTKSGRTGRECAAAFGFAITLAVILAPLAAHADGGVVRAMETRGAFVITIFSPPEVSSGLPADVTVMVQRRDTGEVLTDAAVELGFVPPAGASLGPNEAICSPANNSPSPTAIGAPGRPASIRATRAQAANKLLYAASVVFPAVGDWQLRVTVREGSEEVGVTCVLPVETAPRRLQSLWPLLALPPFAIALFTMNQWLRRRTATTIRVELGRGSPAAGSPASST